MHTLVSVEFNPYLESTTECQKVLVVEDDPVWQLAFERALKLIDPKVDIRFSSNANEAFDLLNQESHFDLVIADQLLQGAKTGLDLWDILLTQNLEIPFVIVSATKQSTFISRLMPYRKEMIPRYIEKSGSISDLSEQLASAFFPALHQQ